MRMDKLTSRFQQALADAQSLAVGRDHNFIEPAHLLLAMLDQSGGGARPRRLSTRMAASLLQFMKTGDPNGGALPHWAPYDRDRRTTMDFDTEIAAVDDPDGAERAAWG